METIKTLVEAHPCKVFGPAVEASIAAAEQALGFRFPEGYRRFLSTFGTITCNGNELMGLGPKKNGNVVFVTLEERRLSKDFPRDYVVLFYVGVEGICVLMDSRGKIYERTPTGMKRIYDSFEDWLSAEFFQGDVSCGNRRGVLPLPNIGAS